MASLKISSRNGIAVIEQKRHFPEYYRQLRREINQLEEQLGATDETT